MKTIISEIDLKMIRNLLLNRKIDSGKLLGQEISTAQIVKEENMNKKIVRLNSIVEVLDLASKKLLKICIVLPDCVDLKNHRISVFSPLSTALFGYKENDQVLWKTPTGETNFKILKVLNE